MAVSVVPWPVMKITGMRASSRRSWRGDTLKEMRGEKPRRTKYRVDGKGRTMLPGLIDAHGRAFGARRIGVLTPYRADVNRNDADYIRARGFEVPVFGSFNEENDGIVASISPFSVKNGIDAIRKLAEVDAVFVSCTSVRLAEAAADIEDSIGIPVTSSNHAMAWHALRLAGIDDRLPQFGRLFTLPLAD